VIRYLHICDRCGCEMRADSQELPKHWTRTRRTVEGVAGRPLADYCLGCTLGVYSAQDAKRTIGATNRRAVANALRERPEDNDAGLALWLAGAGVTVSPETVRRHRTALGVPARRTRGWRA